MLFEVFNLSFTCFWSLVQTVSSWFAYLL